MIRKRSAKPSASKLLLWTVGLLLFFVMIGVLIQTGREREKNDVAPSVFPQNTKTDNAQPAQTASPDSNKPSPGVPGAIVLTPEKNAVKQSSQPLIALIIDDLGQVDLALVSRICSLNIPMTVAILPFLPHSHDSARVANSRGLEVILHMPMEPVGYPGLGKNPGPGAVMSVQSEAEVRERVVSAMRDIPFAVGLNNHMGSRITPDRARMAWILDEAKKNNWFFLDSRTEKDTVAMEVARELGIPALERKVFLDDSHNPAEIAHQWERAMALAKQEGQVVIIGHIHLETIAFLEKAIPAVKNEMVFVRASVLAR